MHDAKKALLALTSRGNFLNLTKKKEQAVRCSDGYCLTTVKPQEINYVCRSPSTSSTHTAKPDPMNQLNTQFSAR